MDSVRSQPPRRPLVVLLDDEPRILSSLTRLLRNDPLELLTTESPGQALEWIRTRPVRLVIADYRMPALDGIRFLEAVREIAPSVIRFMLTGYPGESLILKCLERGLLELIPKPWDNAELRRRLLARLGESGATKPPVPARNRLASPASP
jgi:response regulator RpfG family c-di-GMP phosphodiesterase